MEGGWGGGVILHLPSLLYSIRGVGSLLHRRGVVSVLCVCGGVIHHFKFDVLMMFL